MSSLTAALEARVKAIGIESIVCEFCKGAGWTAEHNPDAFAHDEDGECLGFCPVQVQCNACNGTGINNLLPSALDWIAEAAEVMKIRHTELSEHKKRIESYWSLNEFAVWRDELARLESLLARVKEGV
jgi:hypothetical protein